MILKWCYFNLKSYILINYFLGRLGRREFGNVIQSLAMRRQFRNYSMQQSRFSIIKIVNYVYFRSVTFFASNILTLFLVVPGMFFKKTHEEQLKSGLMSTKVIICCKFLLPVLSNLETLVHAWQYAKDYNASRFLGS